MPYITPIAVPIGEWWAWSTIVCICVANATVAACGTSCPPRSIAAHTAGCRCSPARSVIAASSRAIAPISTASAVTFIWWSMSRIRRRQFWTWILIWIRNRNRNLSRYLSRCRNQWNHDAIALWHSAGVRSSTLRAYGTINISQTNVQARVLSRWLYCYPKCSTNICIYIALPWSHCNPCSIWTTYMRSSVGALRPPAHYNQFGASGLGSHWWGSMGRRL